MNKKALWFGLGFAAGAAAGGYFVFVAIADNFGRVIRKLDEHLAE